MDPKTKEQVLAKGRRHYAKAGTEYKRKLLDEAVALFGYHRKAAIGALRERPAAARAPALVGGRPREYDPGRLLPVLKPIWFAALQPCGSRLAALLPEWLPAYEDDHRRLDADLRRCLLLASARTLEPFARAVACVGAPPRRHPARQSLAPEHPGARHMGGRGRRLAGN